MGNVCSCFRAQSKESESVDATIETKYKEQLINKLFDLDHLIGKSNIDQKPFPYTTNELIDPRIPSKMAIFK